MTPESIKQLMQKSVDEIIESIDFEKQSLSEIIEKLRGIEDFLKPKDWVQHIFANKYGPQLKKIVWEEYVVKGKDGFGIVSPELYKGRVKELNNL